MDEPEPRKTPMAHDFVERGETVGFFTDPTVCIGCKACEVACKEYNRVPESGAGWQGSSYDHTGALGASSWRHVKFLEEPAAEGPMRWLFLSDVCKHCEVAGCLEACPTGAIVRTEVGSVLVQDDVCNGCGYCVVNCPFGVIDRRPSEQPGGGGAYKCTFCYDRQVDGLAPACAKACPTESIRFGPLDQLRREAAARVEALQARGSADVQVYDPRSVGGTHALFLVPGPISRFGLPEDPVVPTRLLASSWASALIMAALSVVLVLTLFGGMAP